MQKIGTNKKIDISKQVLGIRSMYINMLRKLSSKINPLYAVVATQEKLILIPNLMFGKQVLNDKDTNNRKLLLKVRLGNH